MEQLIRSIKWSDTPVGSPSAWPQSLRTTVGIILYGQIPMALYWGPDLVLFYNEAYRAVAGYNEQYRDELGKPAAAMQTDNRDEIAGLIRQVLAGERPVSSDVALPGSYANRKREDAGWQFNYGPVPDESGRPVGVLVTGVQTMAQTPAGRQAEESERTLRSFLMQAPFAICILRGTGFFIEAANSHMLRLWDRTAEEVEGKSLFTALPEAGGQEYEEILANVLLEGKPFQANEVPVRLRGNGLLSNGFLNLSYECLRDLRGHITGIICIAVEVTELVLIRKAVEQNKETLDLAMEIGKLGNYNVNLQNGRATYSPKIREWFGMPEQEATMDDILSRVYQEDQQEVNQAIQSSLEQINNGYHDVTYRMSLPGSGQYRYLRSVGKVQNRDGVSTNIIGIIQDVTQEVESRHSLEKSEETLQSAVELAELATWVIELPSFRILFSARLREWLGIYNHVHDLGDLPLVKDNDRSRITEVLRKSVEPGGNGIFDATFTIVNPKTGQQRIVHAAGITSYDAVGKAVSISGIVQDITIQKQMQLALENEVRLRTEELAVVVEELRYTNLELTSSNNLLIKSNEELQQYAFVASHDLQEPIRKMRMFATKLLSGESHTPEMNRTLLQKIDGSAKRMSLLINDLLEFSRLLKSDKLLIPVDLQEIVANVVNDFELLIEDKKAEITVGHLPRIEAVKLQMNQLFYNLINNAIKFSKPDVSPSLWIDSETVSHTEVSRYISKPLLFTEYHHITVKDNGIGFEEQYSEQIFEVFKRLNNLAIYPGSGIGLAMCKRIAENHQGVLFADSRLGKGSVFHLFLPAEQQEFHSILPAGLEWTTN